MFTSEHLSEVRKALAAHRVATTKIFEDYRNTVSGYDTQYVPECAKQKRAEAKQLAQNRITQVDKAMSEEVKKLASEIRNALYDAVTTSCPPLFAAALNSYVQSGVKMQETEIRAFARYGAGNYAALRSLQAVAGKSGFKVAIPTADEIERDIQRIERAAWLPTMYAPPGFHAEGKEILGERPYFRDDGSVRQRTGEADALYLHLMERRLNDLDTELETAVPERWKGPAAIVIEKIEQAEGMTAEDVKQQQKAAEYAERKNYADNLEISRDGMNDPNAAAIESENARAAAKAQTIRDKYAGKK